MSDGRNRDMNIFGPSFIDVLANAVGGLAFLLVMATLMISMVVFSPPRILTQKLPDGYHLAGYETWLAAREGLGAYRWRFGAGQRPAGLDLDTETGRLWGRLELPEDAGGSREYVFSVVCRAEVAEGDSKAKPREDVRKLRLLVRRDAPAWGAPLGIEADDPLPEALGGEPYPLVLAASGGSAPYRWRLEGSLPHGLRLAEKGKFEGKPGAAGIFSFGAIVRDQQGREARKSLSLRVAEKHPPPPPTPPLVIRTSALPAASALSNYVLFPAAEGGVAPYRWGCVSGPGWLRGILDDKAVGGRPELEDVGSSRVTLMARDAEGRVRNSEAMELEVRSPPSPSPPPLRLKTRELGAARAGTSHEIAWAAEGGYPPYLWEDPNPAATRSVGLVFESERGVTSGTPRTVGVHRLQTRVRDRLGDVAEGSFELEVEPSLQPLKILTVCLPTGRVGTEYDSVLAAQGGFSPYSWNMTSGELPAGIILEEVTGRLRGEALRAGRWEQEFAVRDASGKEGDSRLETVIEVMTRKDVPLLVVKTRSLPELVAGRPTAIALACEGGAPPYSWRCSGALPKGLRVQEGALCGIPREAGRFALRLIAEDSLGQQAEADTSLRTRRMVPWWVGALLVGFLLLALCLLWLAWKRLRRTAPRLLEILTASVPNARASLDYSVHLACTGGLAPYRWRVVEGDLPPGMQLGADGRLWGRPLENVPVEEPREFSFVVEVQDVEGATARRRL